MSDLKIYDDYNTLPEQVQINKDDIKTLNAKIDTITSNIANLGWELKTDDYGNKWYIPKGFDETIPYSLTNTTDLSSVSGLNIYKDSDGYVGTALTTYIPEDDNYVGIITGHLGDGYYEYFCNLSMPAVEDNASINQVSYIATSSSPQLVENKKDSAIATMGWINKYYLTKSDASNTYLSKTDASNTYVTIQDYDERFETGDISLTTEGFNKIKTMAEKEGTTITLIAPTDFYENIQVSNICEFILSVYYNGNPIYRNIHLMPNQSIDDYTAYQDATEYTWYTGHAMLNLPSQNNGYFAISYQNDTRSQLILTLIAHY